eukprot:5270121-Pyramimonas_sp.AAC.1
MGVRLELRWLHSHQGHNTSGRCRLKKSKKDAQPSITGSKFGSLIANFSLLSWLLMLMTILCVVKVPMLTLTVESLSSYAKRSRSSLVRRRPH